MKILLKTLTLCLFLFIPFSVSALSDDGCKAAGSNIGECIINKCSPEKSLKIGDCTNDVKTGNPRLCCAPVNYKCVSKNGECRPQGASCTAVFGGSCSNGTEICCQKGGSKTEQLTDSQCGKLSKNAICFQPDKECQDQEGFVQIGECTPSNGKPRKCCAPKEEVGGTPSGGEPGNTSPSASSTSFSYTPLEEIPGQGKPEDLVSYINALFMFSLAGVGIAALVMVIIGGFLYVSSAGNSAQIDKGKKFITDAIIGVVVMFGSYLLLFTINPDLVNINLESLTKLVYTPEEMPAGSGRHIAGNCEDIDQTLSGELNAAASAHGVPAGLLASFLKRECRPAMTIGKSGKFCTKSHDCSPTQGCVSGPMQFQDGTWGDFGCGGDKNERTDALVCGAKKIKHDSGDTDGNFTEAEIRQAAGRYCGSCVSKSSCGGNYCDGIVADYNIYSQCETS